MDINCQHCNHKICDIPEEWIGRLIRCESCRQLTKVKERKSRGSLKQGWIFFKSSLAIVAKRPILALPIFCSFVTVPMKMEKRKGG